MQLPMYKRRQQEVGVIPFWYRLSFWVRPPSLFQDIQSGDDVRVTAWGPTSFEPLHRCWCSVQCSLFFFLDSPWRSLSSMTYRIYTHIRSLISWWSIPLQCWIGMVWLLVPQSFVHVRESEKENFELNSDFQIPFHVSDVLTKTLPRHIHT